MTTATVNSSSGVNVNTGSANYIADFPGLFSSSLFNYGYFNSSYTNASQYGVAANLEVGTGAYTGGDAMLAEGNLTYSTSTHVLSGELDTLYFGDELNGVTVSGTGTTSTAMSLGTTEFSLTGLDLDSSQGDDVHGILYGMMTGDETALLNFLATNAVTFNGGTGADSYQGGTQIDTLIGGAGADTLLGGGAADVISGGNGADILRGEAGADSITSGAGNDTFLFAALSESTTSTFDTLTTFNAINADASHDLIDVSALDLSAFTGSTATANSIWYSSSAGKLYADTTGDTTADFAVAITTLNGTFDASDFVL